ncbi:hypothetical protein BC937DRAFT_95205, partial [Endogone sp. FLAS-F59071]
MATQSSRFYCAHSSPQCPIAAESLEFKSAKRSIAGLFRRQSVRQVLGESRNLVSHMIDFLLYHIPTNYRSPVTKDLERVIKVLDVGCGTGLWTIASIPHFTNITLRVHLHQSAGSSQTISKLNSYRHRYYYCILWHGADCPAKCKFLGGGYYQCWIKGFRFNDGELGLDDSPCSTLVSPNNPRSTLLITLMHTLLAEQFTVLLLPSCVKPSIAKVYKQWAN